MKKKFAIAVIVALGVAPFAVGVTGASAAPTKKAAVLVCAGKTKPKAIKAIGTAYNSILNGSLGLTAEQKTEFLQYAGGKKINQAFRDKFFSEFAKNAAAAATVTIAINRVKCTGKKTADVDFDLVIGGTDSGLAPGNASAVLDGKVWKFSAITMCDMWALADTSTLENEPCLTILTSG